MAITNTTALLDALYIKENTAVYQNVEDKFINPAIIRCQNAYIKDITGAKLFGVIINEYAANMSAGTAISTRISDLVDTYVLPTLMYYVIYDTIDDFRLKITNQGILKPKSIDAGDAPELSEIQALKKSMQSKAEYYASQMIDFLLLNVGTYPEYLQSDADDSTPGTTKPFNGFSIGGNNCDCRDNWAYWHPNLNV
jgi:uncharacterized protein YfkK (UPF0435 family)